MVSGSIKLQFSTLGVPGLDDNWPSMFDLAGLSFVDTSFHNFLCCLVRDHKGAFGLVVGKRGASLWRNVIRQLHSDCVVVEHDKRVRCATKLRIAFLNRLIQRSRDTGQLPTPKSIFKILANIDEDGTGVLSHLEMEGITNVADQIVRSYPTNLSYMYIIMLSICRNWRK